jgi:hypothetical protein
MTARQRAELYAGHASYTLEIAARVQQRAKDAVPNISNDGDDLIGRTPESSNPAEGEAPPIAHVVPRSPGSVALSRSSRP